MHYSGAPPSDHLAITTTFSPAKPPNHFLLGRKNRGHPIIRANGRILISQPVLSFTILLKPATFIFLLLLFNEVIQVSRAVVYEVHL